MSSGEVTTAREQSLAAPRNAVLSPSSTIRHRRPALPARRRHVVDWRGRRSVAGISMGLGSDNAWDERNDTPATRTIAHARARAVAPTTGRTSRRSACAVRADTSNAATASHARITPRCWRDRAACARSAASRRRKRCAWIIAIRPAGSAACSAASAILGWAATPRIRRR